MSLISTHTRSPNTRALIEDGRRHLMFGSEIKTGCPVHILQGMKDPDVPWRHALKLVEHHAEDDCARGTERVSESDRATIDVRDLVGDAEFGHRSNTNIVYNLRRFQLLLEGPNIVRQSCQASINCAKQCSTSATS